MAYVPRFQKQLVKGVPTAGEDCVVRSASMGIDYATRGQVVPGVWQFRKRAGNMKSGLNTEQLEQGVESYNTPAETAGYTNLLCQRQQDGRWNDIITALRANQWVCCFINYGWVNDNWPALSGDKAYRGTHCVGALCIRYVKLPGGKRQQQVRVWDPTYDGRRPEIPQGPQWWSVGVLRTACAKVEGVSEFRGGIIPISRPLVWE